MTEYDDDTQRASRHALHAVAADVDWERVLTTAAKLGVKVWSADRDGVLREVLTLHDPQHNPAMPR